MSLDHCINNEPEVVVSNTVEDLEESFVECITDESTNNNTVSTETVSSDSMTYEDCLLKNMELSPKVNFEIDPLTYKDAINSKNRRNWINAMQDELEDLKNNNAWSLVEKPIGINIVDCRWVYKTKTDSDPNKKRYRARLVAKGFSQESVAFLA